MNHPARDSDDTTDDTSTRNRILAATAEVLGRSGQTKLSLSEVALQAGVSRPTLYRWFADKQALLEAPSLKSRAEVLVAITEIELARGGSDPDTTLQ